MLQTKRQSFAREFLVDHNATQAAVRAGYSERTAKQQGSRLLTYADVQAEIAELERAQREVEAVDRHYVLTGLRRLAETAESESARVRSLELLGKSLKMFTETVETVAIHEQPDLKSYTLDELLELKAVMSNDQAKAVIPVEAKVLDS